MKRKEDKIDPIRSNFGTIHREPVSLEQKIGNVLSYARRKRRFLSLIHIWKDLFLTVR